VADVRAFQGVRYNPRQYGSRYNDVIAPPYDVLTAADKDRLLARDAHNIVAVDLPHVPPESAGPDDCYREAADRLSQWREDGTLIRDEQPAIYVYHQEFECGGPRRTRVSFLAAVRIESFGEGSVFPHEHTFGGPKADRLKLMQATRCQLSPVFGLYSDASGEINRLLDVSGRSADVEAELDGVTQRMWVVQDAETVAAVGELMKDRHIYIADGHHRYGTALNYRNLLSREAPLPDDDPARFILVGLCAMEDTGSVILPTHRVLTGFGELTLTHIVDALRTGIALTDCCEKPADVDSLVPADDPNDLVVYVGPQDGYLSGRFTDRDRLAKLEPDKSTAWRSLDLAYVHRYLIDELIAEGLMGGARPTVRYFKRASDAVRVARQDLGVALLCKPCSMAQLRAVSEAGDLMPQKSTFFYPKLATGLVMRPLA
jgi:uncharacterized protein (DUF1015 family)